MIFERQVCGIERVWLVAGELDPPFAIQCVIEGEGVLNLAAWRAAVAEAAEANPGSRLVLRGHLWWSRWVDSGRPPPVTEVDGSAWDGFSEAGAGFLNRPLPPEAGPTCEVLLVSGSPPRVIIRTHHAVMDGRGTLHFTQDIFRCLRGERPLGATATTTALDVARRLGRARPMRNKPDAMVPTGPSRGEAKGFLWRRRFIPGRHSRLLPRVAVALAACARELAEDDGALPPLGVRFGIPVDMRRHLPPAQSAAARSTANITGNIRVEVSATMGHDDVHEEIHRQLQSHRDAEFPEALAPARFLPRALMRSIGAAVVRDAHRSAGWESSGVLTNLGKLEVDEMSYDAFRGRSCFFVPPSSQGFAFIMAFTGSRHGVELCASQELCLGDLGRLDACLDRVEAALLGKGTLLVGSQPAATASR